MLLPPGVLHESPLDSDTLGSVYLVIHGTGECPSCSHQGDKRQGTQGIHRPASSFSFLLIKRLYTYMIILHVYMDV